MNGITARGVLDVGVEYAGAFHRTFVLRPATVGDSIAAGEVGGNDNTFGLRVIARQFVSLGDIPKEAITAELLMTMTDHDYRIIDAKRTEIERALARFHDEPGVEGDGLAGAAAV